MKKPFSFQSVYPVCSASSSVSSRIEVMRLCFNVTIFFHLLPRVWCLAGVGGRYSTSALLLASVERQAESGEPDRAACGNGMRRATFKN